jgi:hypothetical protein
MEAGWQLKGRPAFFRVSGIRTFLRTSGVSKVILGDS